MKTSIALVILMTAFGVHAPADAGAWNVVSARWRPDASPNTAQQVWERFIWTEGWSEPEQFYPKYWHPSGSVHVILRNTTGRTDSIKLVEVDGQPLDQICTTPKRAGRVVWYRVEAPQLPVGDDDFTMQKNVPPGEWVECSFRLREAPTGTVKLTFADSDGGRMEVPVEVRAPNARLESVSFSPEIDRLYVYFRSFDGRVAKGKLVLDGTDLSRRTAWTAGPAGSGLTLAEVKLDKPLEYGTHHLLEALTPGETLVQPIRAWDSFFGIGLYGTVTREKVKAAKEHGINTYYSGRNEILNEFQMNTSPGGAGGERQRTPGGWGLLYWYNWDEPDCFDWNDGQELPPMQRIGVNGNNKVLPIQRNQRRNDPRGLNMTLVDNTFKPANWYTYGQIPDVFCSDPYVPLGGRQMDYIWNVMECIKDASTPRPTVAVLWACSLYNKDRRFGTKPPTPEEERMMVFYSIGCGVKGYSYFIDLTQETGEGQFTGIMDIPRLWEAAGRANRDAAALAPYVSIGCPIGSPEVQGWVWVRSLMCGPDAAVVVAVNTNHHVAYETKSELSINIPTKNATIRASLPPSFKDGMIREVVDGKLVPAVGKIERGRVSITLDELVAARAFVVIRKAAK